MSCSLETPSVATSPNVIAPARADGLHPELAIDDLRLLYQWMAGEGVLFSDHDAATSKRDRDRQVKLSLSYPFLLHTILSLSALELYNQDPTKSDFYNQASAHHLAAIHDAQPFLSRTEDAEYGEPLYLFSAFTSLYAFAEPPLRLIATEQSASPEILDDLMNAFNMGRGILAVSAAHADNLKEVSQHQSALWKDEPCEDLELIQGEFPNFNALFELLSVQTDYPDETKAAMKSAAVKLFAIISLLRRRPKSHSSARHIQSWPMHVGKALLELWVVKDPVSLIILAHYAAMVKLRRNLWFFERWPYHIIGQIENLLATSEVDYTSYLEWPKAMLNQTDPEESEDVDYPSSTATGST